jgi:hypothetical protein
LILLAISQTPNMVLPQGGLTTKLEFTGFLSTFIHLPGIGVNISRPAAIPKSLGAMVDERQVD